MADRKKPKQPQKNNDLLIVNESKKANPDSQKKSGEEFTFTHHDAITEKADSPSHQSFSQAPFEGTHSLFFDNPDYKHSNSSLGDFCEHLKLHFVSILKLILEIPKIIFRLIFSILRLSFELIWTIISSVSEFILSIFLIIILLITSCCPKHSQIFINNSHLQDLKSIKWKNVHGLFLFLKIEAIFPVQENQKNLQNEIPKIISDSEIMKNVPCKNLKKMIRSVI